MEPVLNVLRARFGRSPKGLIVAVMAALKIGTTMLVNAAICFLNGEQ